MYRLSAFVIAVAVLVGLVFSGGFLTSGDDQPHPGMPDNVAAAIANSEQQLQNKADQELVDIDTKAKQSSRDGSPVLLPEINKALTQADITAAVQQAGNDGEKTALRAGQSIEQARNAKQAAEEFVRIRMERRMQQQQSVAKSM